MSRSSRYDLEKRAKQGFRGYPIATIAFYGIIGCPHEEGTDYPEGKSCPQCPFWAGRDRFTQERTQ